MEETVQNKTHLYDLINEARILRLRINTASTRINRLSSNLKAVEEKLKCINQNGSVNNQIILQEISERLKNRIKYYIRNVKNSEDFTIENLEGIDMIQFSKLRSVGIESVIELKKFLESKNINYIN